MTRAERTAWDCGERYEQVRRDLVELVRGLPEHQRRQSVPASPAWSVLDVVGHVAGLCHDLNHQNFPAGSSDEWTDEQVRRARAAGFEAVVADWDREAPTFEQGLRDLGYEMGSHFVGDLFVHATDVRAAVGAPIDRSSPTMWIALDFYLDTLDGDLAAEPAALRVRTDGEERVLGTGAVTAGVTAPAFEMLRACAGRRSLAQIRAFDWEGDRERFAPLLSRYATPAADVDP